ncbi:MULTISPECIES: DoxX family protein [Prochlorococcus]|uniref:Uncharacterized membrane protein n=1 Tax=Prochlorococcus marinus (strain SARG / CCMP1375 / SS120) TaxID=167539 RepID=Q7VBT6_PROMA|nr:MULTISPECIES: DoxX family protein [Prochlorococcus]AAQ00051.1 Uncharacterized membrane protein [Prochlorococcus marinus subsp. marinus str. CCMP1375]KGG13848.1 hypothetical protein EV04_0333 [Prochlorococcus marinus str. LG]KGG18981.1 hypothetical protein EV08_1468 [Prochlorococcus marinus str. SS2]KGG23479.1 hypothetical protein EV09_1103 [Prochlorococcus marinus str. SS35]KGG32285.1 hypothetical protein EV10_1400 [Prochlorococcus marinus str. SS51]
MHYFSSRVLDFLGRVFLASTFVVAIPSKFLNYPVVLNTIIQKGIPETQANILLVAAIFLLISGSLALVFGKDQKIGAIFLLIFLVPTTIIFHLKPFQPQAFFMNTGLTGALILAITRSQLPPKAINKYSFDEFLQFLIETFRKLVR